MGEYPGRLHHDTPTWVHDGARFHIRLRAHPNQTPLTTPGLATELLLAVRRYHQLEHWWCELFLLMPDHAHAILAYPATPGMTITIRNWKRGTNRFQHAKWQEGFFHHRLRTDSELNDKWNYIRRNPVVKGLCAAEDDWPWWWSAIVPNPLLEEVERLDPKPLNVRATGP
jgi:REP element-mobilizing transposase RayT